MSGFPALVERGWDFDGDNASFEDYNYGNYIAVLNSHYGRAPFYPGTTVYTFHTYENDRKDHQDDWRTDSTGIAYHHIYGIQQENRTVEQVRMVIGLDCLDMRCVPRPQAEAVLGPGDKTVPLVSLERKGRGQDYNAPQAKLYPYSDADDDQVDHTKILQNAQVLTKIVSLLDAATVDSGTSSEDITPAASAKPAYYMRISGSASILVSDAAGNSTAILSDTMPIRGQVPGVDMLTLGDDVEMVILSPGKPYTVTFEALGEPMAVELTAGTGVMAAQATRYLDFALPVSTTAMLRFTPSGADLLRYDGDGNGSYESTIQPTIAVSSTVALDVTPPVLAVSQSAQQDMVEVRLTAVDSESGVKAVYYSLDGERFQPYSGALQVDPAQTPLLYAFADDNLANRSSLVVEELALPGDWVYLPIVVKQEDD